MSNWDNLNVNIGYGGMFTDQCSDSSDSFDTSGSYANASPPTCGPIRTFLMKVTFGGLLFSVLVFALSFIVAGTFCGLNQNFHILKDETSYSLYVLGYSFLACWFFGISYAIADPDH